MATDGPVRTLCVRLSADEEKVKEVIVDSRINLAMLEALDGASQSYVSKAVDVGMLWQDLELQVSIWQRSFSPIL
jgi:hypothetical protein